MNLQNIDPEVRKLFVPKNDFFLCCDYSNIELRLLAYYLAVHLDDWSMVNEFNAGADLHLQTAQSMWPNQEITDKLRKTAKILNFSIVYGGGTPTLIKQGMAKDYRDAKQLLNRFHSARPGIAGLQLEVQAVLARRGYIFTPWGRQLHPKTEHKALNALIQGSAADLMKDAIVKVSRYLSNPYIKSHLVFTIHDEIGIDGVENELPDLYYNIPNLMDSDKYNDVIPCEVGISIARGNWGNKEPYERT